LEEENYKIKMQLKEDDQKRNNEAADIKNKMEAEKLDLKIRLEDVNNSQKQIENENKAMAGKLSKNNEQNWKQRQLIQDQLEKEKAELQRQLVENSQEVERKMLEETSKQEEEKAVMERKLQGERERLEKKLKDEALEKREQTKQMEDRIRKDEDEKNEILQLYEKMRRENESRKRENVDLKNLLDQEKESLFMSFSRGTSEVRDLLEKEKEEMKAKIDSQRKASAMLEQELVRNREDDMKGRGDLEEMKAELALLHSRLEAPLSVYFNAVREEAYLAGGEEYLTFDHCTVNSGGAMEPGSGVFTAPLTGHSQEINKSHLPEFEYD
jgi:hypothetical protein